MYNIFYCVDNTEIELLKLSLKSIIQNCNSYYNIHILHFNLSEYDINEINSLFFNRNLFNINLIDCNNFYKEKLSQINYKISKCSLLKLHIHKFVDLSIYNKILYLDNDTYINKDLSHLFNIDINPYYCAGVIDYEVKNNLNKFNKFIYIKTLKKYLNSGVLLLNVKKMMENDLFNMLSISEINIKEYLKPVNDIFNAVLYKHVKLINEIYNFKDGMPVDSTDDIIIYHPHNNSLKYDYLCSLINNRISNDIKTDTKNINYNNEQIVEDKPLVKLDLKENNAYNIYYCIDNNGISLLKNSILSLSKCCTSKYIIHVLTYNCNDNDRLNIKENLENDNINIKVYDCTSLFDSLGDYDNYNNSQKHISKVTMLRMYVDLILDITNIDKLLYIDIDTVIMKDLKELFETDINNYYLAAVRDICLLWSGAWSKNKLYRDYLRKEDYFNGGIELLNVKNIIKDNKFNELRLCNFSKKKYCLADQDIYNDVFRNKVKFLDLKFNYKWWLDDWKWNEIVIFHAAGADNNMKNILYDITNGKKYIKHQCNWNIVSKDYNYYKEKNILAGTN